MIWLQHSSNISAYLKYLHSQRDHFIVFSCSCIIDWSLPFKGLDSFQSDGTCIDVTLRGTWIVSVWQKAEKLFSKDEGCVCVCARANHVDYAGCPWRHMASFKLGYGSCFQDLDLTMKQRQILWQSPHCSRIWLFISTGTIYGESMPPWSLVVNALASSRRCFILYKVATESCCHIHSLPTGRRTTPDLEFLMGSKKRSMKGKHCWASKKRSKLSCLDPLSMESMGKESQTLFLFFIKFL